MRIRFLVILFFLSVLGQNLFAQNRTMWATIWSINTPEKIDKIVAATEKYGFNQLMLQVRYRGDAMYLPNRLDSSCANTESRSYILKGADFDPLSYALQQAENKDLEIHAWVPIFVVTPHDLSKINSQHIYYTHKHWLTVDDTGKRMPHDVHEGAFLDAGVPQVQQYMLDILCDIALNYSVDGIQLDYIRYPDSIYGFNPIALEQFEQSGELSIHQWKQNQVSNFVSQAYTQLKNIDSNLQVSAAVFADQQKAVGRFAQDWKVWVGRDYIDQVYVMAYQMSNKDFKEVMQELDDVDKSKVTVALRAWEGKTPYSVHDINKKIRITKDQGYVNFGFYSYSGMIKSRYFPRLKF